MSITVDSYLVYPGNGVEEAPKISGTRVPAKGQLYSMLTKIFERSDRECNIDIAFNPTNGKQENECRDELLAYLRKPTGANGLIIAERLQRVTGNRSGIGLLFLICAKDTNHHKFVIARFPANEGVLAETQGSNLSMSFVERVFMRSAKAYKSVIYKTPSLTGTIWRGRAVDRQIDGSREISHYWIDGFLMSDLTTVGAAASRRLAVAIRTAVRGASPVLRDELVSSVRLMANSDGKRRTAMQMLKKLQVSDDAIELVRNSMDRPDLMDDHFVLDVEEFVANTQYRSVTLDNGALLSAETSHFESVFTLKKVAEGRVRFETEGLVVDERLRKQQ